MEDHIFFGYNNCIMTHLNLVLVHLSLDQIDMPWEKTLFKLSLESHGNIILKHKQNR